jgi:DNA-binding MarR family transcriptional regulator
MVNSVLEQLAVQVENVLLTLNEFKLTGSERRSECSPQINERQRTSALDIAIHAYQSRRARDLIFPHADIFGEPAWDILLDLYIRKSRDEAVSVKGATIGSTASPSTALRWLKVLEKEGLVSLEDDKSDNRRRIVSLTSEGYERMTRLLTEIAR